MEAAVKPFLKWPGGKAKQVVAFRLSFPVGARWRRLVEPFCGSCSVSLGLDYPRYLLADSNAHLVNCLRAAQQDTEALSALSQARFFESRLSATPDLTYLRFRERFNGGGQNHEQAALFLYLNKHCFNGLWRVNRSGQFNASWGKYKGPKVPMEEIWAFAQRFTMDRAQILCSDFRHTLRQCGAGDVVYCDPPYLSGRAGESFAGYTSDGFSLGDHQDLVRLALEANRRGAWVAVSNHDTPEARALYAEATELHCLTAHRSISCDASTRGAAEELLAVFEPADLSAVIRAKRLTRDKHGDSMAVHTGSTSDVRIFSSTAGATDGGSSL